MTEIRYRNRRAVALENERLQVIVSVEGGHLAAITDKETGINPLWTPPWPSIEPSAWSRETHPEYGDNAESRLLAGILGHNLCLDLFGGPSEEEAAAGMTVHGEGSVVPYDVTIDGETLTQRATMPHAQLAFERRITLRAGSRKLLIEESAENLLAWDRPCAWTQHVTLGPPFLKKGETQFRASATRSKVIEFDFTGGKGYMEIGAEFDWPNVPCIGGGTEDMRVFTSREVSGAYSTHLMDTSRETAFFTAYSPSLELAIAYIWRRSDFPWLGIWEENCSRTSPPWNGRTLTRGMEFGASPMPESRRAMISRNGLFGAPGYRWIPAKSKVSVRYVALVSPARKAPENADWDGGERAVLFGG
jgi:hypothetical protein